MCHMAWGDEMMDGKKTKKEWCKQDNFAVKYKHKPMLPDDSIYDYFYLSIKTIRNNVIGNQISLVNKKRFFVDLVPLCVLEMQTQRQRAEVLLCLAAWCIFEVIVFSMIQMNQGSVCQWGTQWNGFSAWTGPSSRPSTMGSVHFSL